MPLDRAKLVQIACTLPDAAFQQCNRVIINVRERFIELEFDPPYRGPANMASSGVAKLTYPTAYSKPEELAMSAEQLRIAAESDHSGDK